MVVTIYMIAPAIPVGIGVYSLFASFEADSRIPRFLVREARVILAAGIVLAFVVAFMMSMAIVHMVKTERFAKAFALGEIFIVIKKIGWVKYISWLMEVFMFAIFWCVLGLTPIVGWFILLIIQPIFGVFLSRSAALLYADAVTSTPPVVSLENKFCIACGAQIPSAAVYCPLCGKSQSG